MPEQTSKGIVDTVITAFGDRDRQPEYSEVEKIMRPLGILSFRIQREVELKLRDKEQLKLFPWIHPWLLVNFALFGDGDRHEKETLNMTPCICFAEYYKMAVKYTTGDEDSRVVEFLENID